MSEYKGRRRAGDARNEGKEYLGRRARGASATPSGNWEANEEEQPSAKPVTSGGLFYDPFSAWNSEDAFEKDHQNVGEAFNIRNGRHEAILENVYSSEIDGGEILTLTPKKRRGPLIVGAVLFLALAIGGAFVFLGQDSELPSEANTKPLVAELEPTYPSLNLSSSQASYTVRSGSVQSSTGSTLSGSSAINSVTTPCAAVGREFCVAGTVNIEGIEGRVLATNQVIVSPVFDDMLEYSQYEATPSVFRGQAVVNFAGAPTRFLIFMDGANGDGWFVEVPLELTQDKVKAISDSFTYQP